MSTAELADVRYHRLVPESLDFRGTLPSLLEP